MSILDRLRELQSDARRLTWIGGLSGAAAALLIGILACGLLDWWWHLDAGWLRGSLLLSVLGVGGYVAWRRWWQPLQRLPSRADLSVRLENQFPSLRGKLASAVEFLEHGVNPQLGSPELQQRLIDRTAKESETINFADVLDRREMIRSIRWLAVIASLAILLVVVRPSLAATALSRLLWPIGNRPWPREVELRLARADLTVLDRNSATRLKSVEGQPLDLFVINAQGELPQPVQLEFRRQGLQSELIELRSTTLRDAKSDRTLAAAAVRLPFDSGIADLRAVGGDDRDMPWRTLELIPLVRLKSFRVKVIPPAYAGEAESKWLDGITQLKALVGSRVILEGTASREIRQAAWSDDPANIQITNKTQVRTERLIASAESKTWRMTLADADGFENPIGLSLNVLGLADPPPNVVLMEPAVDQTVTPNALVKLATTATDDRGLRDVRGDYQIEASEEAASSRAPLNSRSQETARTDASENESRTAIAGFGWPEQSANDGARPVTKQVTLRHKWPLVELSLRPGDRVRVQVVTRDACDVGEPRVGRSAMRTLTVVSAETKGAEIASRLDLLLQDLLNLVDRQVATQTQASELREQLDKARELRPQDRDSAKRVELDQRQIDQRLTGRDDGVTARARSLLNEIEINQLPSSPVQQRLGEVAEAIERLGNESLPPLESSLREIVKLLTDDPSNSLEPSRIEPLNERFRATGEHQAVVLTTLANLVRELTQWRDRRELARELADLAESQSRLARETAESAPQTLGKSVTELSRQQQADLAKLSDRQARQAEQIEQLRQRLTARSKPATSENSDVNRADAAAAQAARETLSDLDERTIAARSREAARDIAANNLGQAAASQQQAAQDLKSLADKLEDAANPSESTADQLADAVRELIARQQQVIDETERLASEQAKAGKWTRPLSKAALQLADAEQSLAEATRKLQEAMSPDDEHAPDSEPAVNAGTLMLDRATRDLIAAADGLRDKRLNEETRSSEQAAMRRLQALAEALSPKEASTDPTDADKDASRDDQKNSQDPAQQQPVPPVAQLQLLKQLQSEIRGDTERLDADRPQPEATSDPQAAQVKQLSDDQKQITAATRELLSRFPAPPKEAPDSEKTPDEAAPRDGAITAMQRAAEALSRRETGKPTQTDQRAAESQLEELSKIWRQRAERQQQLARTGQTAPSAKDDRGPKTSDQSAEGRPGQPRGRDTSTAQKSSDRDNTGPDREGLAQRDRQLREAIWGHLPPALREKMLNLPHDKILPKYADAIRRYYEALAEERDRH